MLKDRQAITAVTLLTSAERVLRRRFLVLPESADGTLGAMLPGVRTVTSSVTSGVFN